MREEKRMPPCLLAETDMPNVLSLRFQMTARIQRQKKYQNSDISDNRGKTKAMKLVGKIKQVKSKEN